MRNKKAYNYTLTAGTGKFSTRDFIDYDYVSKLSTEERQWLLKFTGEYYGARKSKDPIHGDEYWKDLYHQNNCRNRCIMGSKNHKRKLDDDGSDGEQN